RQLLRPSLPTPLSLHDALPIFNRMIEPSSGRIVFDGEDVTGVNPDLLRRRIGYVIQQIGLFPHQTIAENVATVPRLLGWDKARIDRKSTRLNSSHVKISYAVFC